MSKLVIVRTADGLLMSLNRVISRDEINLLVKHGYDVVMHIARDDFLPNTFYYKVKRKEDDAGLVVLYRYGGSNSIRLFHYFKEIKC